MNIKQIDENHIDTLFYLIPCQTEDGIGLKFPSEIEDKNYYANGGFYLVEKNNRHFKGLEIFIDAVYGDELKRKIPITLKDKSMIANIDQIGNFSFLTNKVKIKYSGNNKWLKNQTLRKFRIKEVLKAEEVCWKYNFYFVGYAGDYNP